MKKMLFINRQGQFTYFSELYLFAWNEKLNKLLGLLKVNLIFTNYFFIEKVEKLLTIPDQIKDDLIVLIPRLRRFAITLTRSIPDADDLLQEACAAALDKWEQYDQSQPFDRWMFRIVRNSWISEVRKRKVRIGQGQVPAEEAIELTVKNNAIDTIAMKDALGKISELAEELSQPLLLVCSEGYSYAEVSELLEIPKGTVMSRIYRARQILASRLGDQDGDAK